MEPRVPKQPPPLGHEPPKKAPKGDFRERLAYMVVALVVMVFVMIFVKPELTQNDGFMILAQAIVVSAFIGGAVAWAYSQGKNSDEDRAIIREQAQALKASNDPAWTGGPVGEATVVAEQATVVVEDDPKASNRDGR